jgi:hypothetical protein
MNNIDILEYQLKVWQVDEESISNLLKTIDKMHVNTLINNELTIFAMKLYDHYVLQLKYHNNIQLIIEYLKREYPNTLTNDDIDYVINNINFSSLTSLNNEELKVLAHSIYDNIDANRFIDIDDYR